MSQNCCCSDGCCCSGDVEQTNVVSTSLLPKDYLGAFKARCGIGRMDYKVDPGLYEVGKPDGESPVLVSANYKLTFDVLRKNLAGIDCWLLILDTKGVNVWCAAGKGTFGTDELVTRVNTTGLAEIVTHKQLILPQLCASGVDANEVTRLTGFSVIYGPVRASDVKAFIEAGCQATKEMREVNFTLRDRLILTPMELVPAVKVSWLIMGGLFITNLFSKRPFNGKDAAILGGAVLTGTVLTPVLLPWIPGKAFSWKGGILGLGWTAGALTFFRRWGRGNRLKSAGELLLAPAISSFAALNFTGSSTYTSPSGVKKEMEKALPFIVGAVVVGGALTLGVHLFGGRGSK